MDWVEREGELGGPRSIRAQKSTTGWCGGGGWDDEIVNFLLAGGRASERAGWLADWRTR